MFPSFVQKGSADLRRCEGEEMAFRFGFHLRQRSIQAKERILRDVAGTIPAGYPRESRQEPLSEPAHPVLAMLKQKFAGAWLAVAMRLQDYVEGAVHPQLLLPAKNEKS
jgi:hypothetical protein